MAAEPVIGIDLGTSNSAVAVVRGGRAAVARRGEERIVPSIVAAHPDGRILVGHRAKQLRAVDAKLVVSSSKRLLGRRFDSVEVQRLRKLVPYPIVEGPNESVMVDLGGTLHSPVEIAAHILRYLREIAEDFLCHPVHRAVLAVPANFTDAQRSATRTAARLADIDVVRIINEPTAAALAYGYSEDVDRRVAIYDFGGGTFDVTILQITRNVFEVLATSGDTFLGGDDIDEIIVERMLDSFSRRYGVTLHNAPAALVRLRTLAEHIKIDLSERPLVTVHIEDLIDRRPLDFTLSQEQLRDLIRPLIERTVPICVDALAAAGISPKQIDETVLVGGTTRLPMVRELVGRTFGKAPQTSINPMNVVAIGAAIQGAALAGALTSEGTSAVGRRGSAVLIDVTPHSLGVRTVGGFVDMVIPRNTPIPIEQTRLFTTSTDGQRTVHVRVCQGESTTYDANNRLGELVLSDLRPAPRGEVTIAVTFEIDPDGLLKVRATDQETGQMQSATMRVFGTVSEEQLRKDGVGDLVAAQSAIASA